LAAILLLDFLALLCLASINLVPFDAIAVDLARTKTLEHLLLPANLIVALLVEYSVDIAAA